ncbi:hypothetical protein GCM10027597_49970 [Saccharopolyspora tripterygii]
MTGFLSMKGNSIQDAAQFAALEQDWRPSGTVSSEFAGYTTYGWIPRRGKAFRISGRSARDLRRMHHDRGIKSGVR